MNPLVPALGVLVAANVMNNRIAPRWAPVTSAVATGALAAIARRGGLTWPELGFRTPRRGAAIGGTLAAGVAAGYAAGVALPRTRPLFHDERALALSRRRLLEEALVQVPAGTVLLEEVAFRGVLPALLGRSVPARTAVAASAALFGLWHVLPALDMARANPALGRLTSGETGDGVETARLVAGTVVSTGIAGLLFHELRRRGGLLAPSVLHVATNSLGYLAARAARRLSPHPPGRDHARVPGGAV
ncbi:CPBP family intramembrane metalloprotease [Planotetraspora sp. A-T 1434]|uniref:CPBP family intramembrane glutamic endopeptidase n=1 Tax=Planotetraspora sp. A-T 1434 TaxID=2979219 RepID=UPI0021BF12F2|nr:CPBP family intramembrane glutamic endopeptidase [Planotetraspora sp. A-T 1434]MCT9928698.1 CPBP family intramembrane metalloprotease [Planotetraspora sp. A-T 1434]